MAEEISQNVVSNETPAVADDDKNDDTINGIQSIKVDDIAGNLPPDLAYGSLNDPEKTPPNIHSSSYTLSIR